MTLGPAQASKGTATPVLRSLCGPNPHEQPRTRANSVPRGSAFSGVFARVRLCSRNSKESGRQGLPADAVGIWLGVGGFVGGA
jgi:hypothetical protein